MKPMSQGGGGLAVVLGEREDRELVDVDVAGR